MRIISSEADLIPNSRDEHEFRECTTAFTHVDPIAHLNSGKSHISRMQIGIDECSAVCFR